MSSQRRPCSGKKEVENVVHQMPVPVPVCHCHLSANSACLIGGPSADISLVAQLEPLLMHAGTAITCAGTTVWGSLIANRNSTTLCPIV